MYIELDEDDSILGEIGKIKWANISKKNIFFSVFIWWQRFSDKLLKYGHLGQVWGCCPVLFICHSVTSHNLQHLSSFLHNRYTLTNGFCLVNLCDAWCRETRKQVLAKGLFLGLWLDRCHVFCALICWKYPLSISARK